MREQQRARIAELRAAMDRAGAHLSDEQAIDAAMVYRVWAAGEVVSEQDIRRYGDALYRCVQAHITQADWTPELAQALWVRVGIGDWPEWVEPTGAHDAYSMGARVSHQGNHWVSAVDANVWMPGVHGWERG